MDRKDMHEPSKNIYLLSLVVPLWNAHERSRKLVDTLARIPSNDVEVILVDDGSSQEEHELIIDDANHIPCSTQVVRQGNKGPGGARNTGLSIARGHFVWFVDSDDYIDLEAINELRELKEADIDFVDFRLSKRGKERDSIKLSTGLHSVGQLDKEYLARNFGRLCTKAYRRKFLVENRIYYPEFCIYEDNYLKFTMPIVTRSFFRSDKIAYYQVPDYHSITRTGLTYEKDNFFDRLFTSFYGAKSALSFSLSDNERRVVIDQFRCQFLINTTKRLAKASNGKENRLRLFKAYKSCLNELLQEQEYHSELDSSFNKCESLAHTEVQANEWRNEWNHASPDPSALQQFLDKRNAYWGRGIYLPS